MGLYRFLMRLVVIVPVVFYSGFAHAQCPPYTVERATSIDVTPDDNLNEVVQSAAANTTVFLAGGIYQIKSNLQIRTDSITLRSKTGNRDDVILDGSNGSESHNREEFTPEVVAVSGNDVHLVDITVRYARDHGIHIYPPADHSIRGCRMHNIHVYDCGQQLIKVNSNGNSEQLCWVDSGILEGSLIEFIDNSVMEDKGSYFYTGGLDVHGGEGWVVRWNNFRNIQRDGKLMEHSVHFWSKSRGTIVENNRFENVYRGIGFGMKQEADGLVRMYEDGAGENPYRDHIDGVIRNNVIFNRVGIHLESGMELWNVFGTEVRHNTVYSADEPFSSIEYRWAQGVTIANNLVSQRIMARNTVDMCITAGNIPEADDDFFVDAVLGDLHLSSNAAEAIDRGTGGNSIGSEYDHDGRKRDEKPDIGAYEYSSEAVLPFVFQVRERRNGIHKEICCCSLLGRKITIADGSFDINSSHQLLVISGITQKRLLRLK